MPGTTKTLDAKVSVIFAGKKCSEGDITVLPLPLRSEEQLNEFAASLDNVRVSTMAVCSDG